MANSPSDQGIPLLTEVIGPQSDSETGSPPASPLTRQAAPVVPQAPTTRATAPAAEAATAPRLSPSPMPAAVPIAPAGTTTTQSRPAITTTPDVPAAPASTSASPASTAMPSPPSQVSPALEAAAAADAWRDSDLRDLENELRLQITRQVLGRIDFVLDHRVRNTVTEVVDAAIDALAVEIKRGLHETLTDIVGRAVAQEISRLQSGKK